MREWVVPECLHVPVAADDESAITDHIGDIVRVYHPDGHWSSPLIHHRSATSGYRFGPVLCASVFFEPLQVWVNPSYTRYRQAYVRAKGHESVSGKVLAHVYNRRMAMLRGYGFVRLVPVSRRANSSSSFTEQWGVELAAADLGARRRQRGLRMQYADLSDLLVMLDINLGGGVQEVFRAGQDLIEIPGLRSPQA